MSAGGAAAEEGVAPDPLDTPQVVLMSASEEAGDCISFRSMAQMLHAGKLSPEDKVFVPPALLEDARVVSEMVDMEDVAEMDDDDIDELARQFMDELVPKTAVDFSADRDCELQSGLDAMDVEVARIASSQPLTAALYDRGLGNFRGPVELPPELAAVAERDLGETVEVRTKALKDLRARLEQLEAEGVKGQPIQFPRKDDQFLICFLRSRKFRLKDAEKVGPRCFLDSFSRVSLTCKACQVIVKFTRYMHSHASWLGSMDARDPCLDPAYLGDKIGMHVLPGTTRTGGRVVWTTVSTVLEKTPGMFDRLNKEQYCAEDLHRMGVRQMIHAYSKMLSDPFFQVKGLYMVVDYEGSPTLKQYMRLDRMHPIKHKKNFFGLFQDMLPIRFGGIMILNQPKWIKVSDQICANSKLADPPLNVRHCRRCSRWSGPSWRRRYGSGYS